MRRAAAAFAIAFVFGLAGTVALAKDVFIEALTVTDGCADGGHVVSAAMTGGRQYSVQCTRGDGGMDAFCHYKVCTSSTCVATIDNWRVPADGQDVPFSDLDTRIAVCGEPGIGGTARIYSVLPSTHRWMP